MDQTTTENEAIQALDETIGKRIPRPKTIRASIGLVRALRTRGRIKDKLLSVSLAKEEFPHLDGDIVVKLEPEFDDFAYDLIYS